MNLIFILLFLLEINKCLSDESMKMNCAMQQNQIYARCGNKCKNSCKGLIEKNCAKDSCVKGCFCDEGYYRNERGSCVNKSQCYKEKKKKETKKEKKPVIYIKNKFKVKIKLITNQPEDGVLTTQESQEETTQEPEEETSQSTEDETTQGTEDETTQGTEDETTQTSEEETNETSTEQTSEMSSDLTSNLVVETETQTQSTETSTEETEETSVATTYQDTTQMVTESSEATEEQTETTSQLSTDVSTEETDTESSTLEIPTTSETSTKPPIKCKINEHYSSCGSKCGESCQIETDNSKAKCLAKCNQGCFCDEGLLRNEKGICIPKDQCVCKIPEQKCKSLSEQFFYCHNECGRTCADQNEDSNKNCPTKCSRGCLCKIGFVRNQSGVCVLPEKCRQNQKKCKPNERHSDCGTDCGKNCEDLANITKTSCNTEKCNIGCFCSQGFFRNHKGVCVSKEKCTTKNEGKSKAKEDCQSFEEYTECGNFCTESCDISKQNIENCPFTCNKGCICKKGLKRNADGVCISEKKCKEKPECGKYEEYTKCGTECGHQCADLSKKNLQCPLACEKGCFCAKGFFRDGNNTCIPKAKCTVDPMDCPESERYIKCGTRCGESCEDLRNAVPCPKECEENCFCNKGLYRNLEGICVKETECELESKEVSKQDCPSNEVFKDCGNKCEESCEDRTDCKKTCQKGCFCDEGYLRHKSGKCVSDDECKAREQCVLCAQNEYYSDCGTDCGNYCVDIGNQPKCEASCRKGCFCKHGFYKNDLGKCVTEEKCNDSPITETYREIFTTWYTEIYTYRVPYSVPPDATPDVPQQRKTNRKSKVNKLNSN